MLNAFELSTMLALFGLVMLAISWQRHRHHRDVSAIAHALIAALLVCGAALLFELGLNYNTYQPVVDLTSIDGMFARNPRSPTPIAELDVKKQPNGFAVTLLQTPSGNMQVFTLNGTQWRLQARWLETQGWLALLGVRSRLRLEHLFSDDVQHPTQGATGKFRISNDAGIHLADWAHAHTSPTAALQTRLIQSGLQPLVDDQRFHVYVKENELEVRQITRKVETIPDTPVTPTLNPHAVKLLKDSELSVPVSTSESSASSAH